jgi:hypothetical protein
MYNTLPKNQRSFDIDLVGETTGFDYKGTFTVKCALSISEKHKLELERTRLSADYANPTAGLVGISIAMSNLSVRVIEGPAWWKNSNNGSDVLDEEVIFTLYEECMKMEKTWKDSLKKQSDEAAKEPGNP